MNYRKCNPLYGWRWFSMGIRIFLSQPWPWLALVGLSLLFLFLLSTLPLLGMYGVFALFPAIAAGFLLASRAVMSRQAISFHHLTEGFKTAGRPLIAVGSLGFLVFLTALLSVILGWRSAFPAFFELVQGSAQSNTLLLQAMQQLLPPILITLSLLVLVAWFTPGLVLFRQLSPNAAMLLSLRAWFANLAPFIVFCTLVSLSYLAMSIVGQQLLNMIMQIVGEQAAGFAAMFISFPIFCIFLSVLFAAAYVSYMDVFETPAPHIETEA